LELLCAGQARRRRTPHRLRHRREAERGVESQDDAVCGKVLADRTVVFIVQRFVLVRLMPVPGVALVRVPMIVVVAAPAVRIRGRLTRGNVSRYRDIAMQRVCVAVMVTGDRVQAGMPQHRDRAVQGDQAARSQFVEPAEHHRTDQLIPYQTTMTLRRLNATRAGMRDSRQL
jgi:hypothetical protein